MRLMFLPSWFFTLIVFIDTCFQMKQESSLPHGFIYCLFTIESLMGTDGYGWSVSKWHCEYKRKITLYISLFSLFKRKLHFGCNKITLDLLVHVYKIELLPENFIMSKCNLFSIYF